MEGMPEGGKFIVFPDPGVIDKNPLPVPFGFRHLEMEAFKRVAIEISQGKEIGSSMTQLDKVGFAEYQRMQKDVFARLVSLGEPVGLVVEAQRERYRFSLKNKSKSGPHDPFNIETMKNTKMNSEELYAWIIGRLTQLGFTVDVLKRRLESFEYEDGEAYDQVAHLMRQRINPDLKIVPALSHFSSESLLKVMSYHANDKQIARVRALLVPIQDVRVDDLRTQMVQLEIAEVIDMLSSPDQWFFETAEFAEKLLIDLDAIPNRLCRLRSTALLIADLADILFPIKIMKEHLRCTYDHSQHCKSWISARLVYKNVLTGKGGYRRAVLEGKVAKKSTHDHDGPDWEKPYFNDVIDEIIELCDHRFDVRPEIAPKGA